MALVLEKKKEMIDQFKTHEKGHRFTGGSDCPFKRTDSIPHRTFQGTQTGSSLPPGAG